MKIPLISLDASAISLECSLNVIGFLSEAVRFMSVSQETVLFISNLETFITTRFSHIYGKA